MGKSCEFEEQTQQYTQIIHQGIKKTTLRSNLMVKYKTDVDRSTQDKVGWEVKELGLDQVDLCLSF